MSTPVDSAARSWPRPVRTGLGPNDVNGRNRPPDAVERARWLGWWIDPVDLVAWHPDDPTYKVHLEEFIEPRHALRLVTHVVQRYHHPGPLGRDGLDARHRLGVGFVVMLDDALQVRDRLSQQPYRAPIAAEVREQLRTIAARVAAGDDPYDRPV